MTMGHTEFVCSPMLSNSKKSLTANPGTPSE